MSHLPANWDSLTVDQQKEYIKALRYNWRVWARPNQLVPWEDDSWDILLILAGRGFGKTRMGAEAIREFAEDHPAARIACVSPTYSAARDVQYLGESGILAVTPEEEIESFHKSHGKIYFSNNSQTQWFSGADAEKFRGPQHHLIWFDELCAYQYPQDTWDMAMMGLRLGEHPRVIITTTPKPTRLIIELVKRAQSGDPKVRLVTGSTFDNAANLPPSTLDALRARYEGTALGRQELYAEVILDAPGALWTWDLLEECRAPEAPELSRIVVAVDPAVSARGDRVNETGIVVAGVGATDRHGYVLEDASIENATPDQWARRAVELYHYHNADRIVIERNQGGDMVRHTLRTVDPDVPIKTVTASKGKSTRAEPVAAAYEQHRIHHVGSFPDLESQMTSWVPTESQGKGSPDRVDALVWAMTELMQNLGTAQVFTTANRELLLPGQYRKQYDPRRIPSF
jgi:phage terminase large subunit-like protein